MATSDLIGHSELASEANEAPYWPKTMYVKPTCGGAATLKRPLHLLDRLDHVETHLDATLCMLLVGLFVGCWCSCWFVFVVCLLQVITMRVG